MSIYIGSARIGENGHITGGKDGDQKQTTSKNDMKGEVSSQLFYVHSKGWHIIRPKSVVLANKLATENKAACDNKNIGYNQNERFDVVTEAKKVKSLADINISVNSDCSSLTRAEVITAAGVDPGNFTTDGAVRTLVATGLFTDAGSFTSLEKTPIYNGDILVTKTKGHIVTVNAGNPRRDTSATQSTSDAVYYRATANVNIRKDAGANKQSLGIVPSGKKVRKLAGSKEANGVKWLHVSVTLSSVKVKGYISSDYLRKI